MRSKRAMSIVVLGGLLAVCSLPGRVPSNSELVRYELLGRPYVQRSTGKRWGGMPRRFHDDIVVETCPEHVDGTVLFQLLADHRLKFEAFPGLRAHEVGGLASEARIYER